MRTAVAFALVATLGLAAVATQGRLPLKQNLEILTEGPMRADRVKDGLYVIRGPFLPCMRGCPPGQTGDGLIHESGDVALRVTPAGLIVVDDKFPDQATEVLAQVKKVSPLPVRYVLNSHHHADHVSGNATVRSALGVDIIGHRNIRENFLRLKQAGEPTITFDDQTSIFLGGVEVRLLWLGRGHTNGDTVIYFPDLQTMHVGDLIIDGMPVIDYPGGGSAVEFLATIDNLGRTSSRPSIRRGRGCSCWISAGTTRSAPRPGSAGSRATTTSWPARVKWAVRDAGRSRRTVDRCGRPAATAAA